LALSLWLVAKKAYLFEEIWRMIEEGRQFARLNKAHTHEHSSQRQQPSQRKQGQG